jgi:hypothetical protein
MSPEQAADMAAMVAAIEIMAAAAVMAEAATGKRDYRIICSGKPY